MAISVAWFQPIGASLRLSLDTREVGRVTIVRCNGRIVAGSESESLRAHVAWLLRDRRAIVLHLGDVGFIDSSGSELVTIDEQQGKLLLVMLGIFSAGATLLASYKGDSTLQLAGLVQWGLSAITLALLGVWGVFTGKRHSYRKAVRSLLVRCEMAMGFYEHNTYLQGDKLYTDKERGFPSKGTYLLWVQLGTVSLAALGFIVILWSHEISGWLHPLAQRAPCGRDLFQGFLW